MCFVEIYINYFFYENFFFLLGNIEEGIWGYILLFELCIKLYFSLVLFYYVIKNLFGFKFD